MNTQSLLFVANWKMNMPFTKACEFINTHLSDLVLLTKKQNATIVICPSFIALPYLCAQTKKTPIKIGAQNCSEYSQGAYTGEVDALSLAEAGCTYALIGHSERRTLFHENNASIGKKITELLKNTIIPIICIGETYNEYISNQVINVLTEQLTPIIAHAKHAHTIIIAYEPRWAIGTNNTPDTTYLTTIFSWLAQTISNQIPTTKVLFLYGGSVNKENAQQFIRMNHVHGLLIGNMSLDFQNFQNIVSSGCDAFTTLK